MDTIYHNYSKRNQSINFKITVTEVRANKIALTVTAVHNGRLARKLIRTWPLVGICTFANASSLL